MSKPLISIVVICKEVSDFFKTKTLPAIFSQTFLDWELIVLPDKETSCRRRKTLIIPTWPKVGPADKKDLGIKQAKGEFVAFIDDDAYPDKNWLKNSLPYLAKDDVAAVCGPGVTPPSDPLLSQVSGWFWSSYLGSGGAGTYRCLPARAREVDDYPTFNLIAKKHDLEAIGGFDSLYWPGEDTKLCHDLVYVLGKKIIYRPNVLVYHQRRPILRSHLKQLGRYGLHRGHFARILPKTSRRVGYFGPPLFTVGVTGGVAVGCLYLIVGGKLLHDLFCIYLLCLIIYSILDILNSIWVYRRSHNLLVSLALVPTVFISHFFNGLMFIKGLTMKRITSKYDRNRV